MLQGQPMPKLRGINFQMTKVEVKNLEKRAPKKDQGNELVYNDNLFGKPILVHYLFKADRLFGFYYTIKMRKIESKVYIKELIDALKQKYNNHYTAFHLHRFTNKTMQVNLSIDRRHDSVSLMLVYTDRPLNSIDSPLLASVREQMKLLVEANKKADINEKL